MDKQADLEERIRVRHPPGLLGLPTPITIVFLGCGTSNTMVWQAYESILQIV